MTIGVSPTQCGNAPSATSSSSWTLTTTADLDAGEVGVLRVALDNISATDGDNSEITSITGGTGTWEKLSEYTNSQGGAALGVTVGAWLFTPSANNATGTVFTITLASNRTQKVAALEKWTVGAGNSLRQTLEAGVVTSQVDAGGGFGSSTYTGLTSLERLYLRVLGAEMSTTASVAATSGFVALSTFRSSTSSPVSLLGESRVNTSTGETSDPAFTPVADKVGIFFALEEYSVGGSGITGTASIALDALTVSAQGDLPVAGSVAVALDALTVAAQGDLPVNAAAAVTLAAMTTAAQGALLIKGSAGLTFGAATVVATGATGPQPVAGSASVTFNALTTAAQGALLIKGSAGLTFGAATVSAAATVQIRATTAVTLAAMTVSASAQLTAAPALNAGLAVTFGAATVSAAATLLIKGSAAVTLAATTVTATSKVSISGQLAATFGALTLAANGASETLPSINAVGAIALAGLTVQSAGSVSNSGIVSVIFSGLTVQAVGRSGLVTASRYLTFDADVKNTLLHVDVKKTIVDVDAKLFEIVFDGVDVVKRLPNKTPTEVWIVAVNIAAWLTSGATVSTVSSAVVGGNVTVADTVMSGAETITVKLSGGTPVTQCTVRVTATLSDGQVFTEDLSVVVV